MEAVKHLHHPQGVCLNQDVSLGLDVAHLDTQTTTHTVSESEILSVGDLRVKCFQKVKLIVLD